MRIRKRRVPVVLQMSATECGASCLAMILSYYGRETSLSECSRICGTSSGGVTAQSIAQAARRFGLRTKALSFRHADLRQVPLPVVVHWNFSHFVVVESWSRKWVGVVDPALGRRRCTREEFDAGFTGVLLTFEPGVHFEPRATGRRLSPAGCISYIARTPGIAPLAAQILAASVCLQALGLTLPICTKLVVDQILPANARNAMAALGAGLVLFIAAQALTTYLRGILLIYLQARLDLQILAGFVEHLLALPFRFFQLRNTGDLLLRVGSSGMIREILTNQTISSILDGAFVLGYLAIFFLRAPGLGLVLLAIVLVQAAVTAAMSGRVRDVTQRDLVAQADSQGFLVQALVGIATVKASGGEARVLSQWLNLTSAQLNASVERGHMSAAIETGTTALRVLSPLLLLWLAAVQVMNGTLSVGTMLALNALAAALFVPLSALLSNAQRVQLAGAHLYRLADILEAEPEQDLRPVENAAPLGGKIEISHLCFRHDVRAPWLLRDISLSIEAGQNVALVGRTGSGKTTLAMLLLGLLEPVEGEIRYDGVSLRCLSYRSLRRQIGVVLQEPFLFSGSIRQNIAFTAPELPFERIVEAAKLAAIHDEIEGMPMGYETRIAEGGSGLSGGQRQRLALARALAPRPSVLLIDEGTSHLDAVTESLVERNLNRLPCTRILIAHRLSTIRNADTIFVLAGGTISERGTHDALMREGGHYAALVESQLSPLGGY